jgi:predicted ATPase
VGEPRQHFAVLWGLTRLNSAQARWRRARELAEQLLGIAAGVGEADLRLEAHRVMGGVLYQTGEFEAAARHLREALALFAAGWHPYEAALYLQPRIFCLFWMGYVLWYLGYPDQAEAKGREALELALEQGDPFGIAAARAAVAVIYQHRGEAAVARDAGDACVAFAERHGIQSFLVMGRIVRGWARVETGEHEGGLGELRRALKDWRALGMGLGAPYFLSLLADSCGRAGLIEEGLAHLDEALRVVEETGERVDEAEMLRLRAELLLRLPGRAPEAEACLGRAVRVAGEGRARSLELRALLSLVRLERRQGRSAGACDDLRRVYGSFTEGLDAPDLAEAGRLLAAAAS